MAALASCIVTQQRRWSLRVKALARAAELADRRKRSGISCIHLVRGRLQTDNSGVPAKMTHDTSWINGMAYFVMDNGQRRSPDIWYEVWLLYTFNFDVLVLITALTVAAAGRPPTAHVLASRLPGPRHDARVLTSSSFVVQVVPSRVEPAHSARAGIVSQHPVSVFLSVGGQHQSRNSVSDSFVLTLAAQRSAFVCLGLVKVFGPSLPTAMTRLNVLCAITDNATLAVGGDLGRGLRPLLGPVGASGRSLHTGWCSGGVQATAKLRCPYVYAGFLFDNRPHAQRLTSAEPDRISSCVRCR
jgi:hypothetical protein